MAAKPTCSSGRSISTANISYFVIIGVTLALVAFQFWLFEHTVLGKKLPAAARTRRWPPCSAFPSPR
jgi:hypothetical protein